MNKSASYGFRWNRIGSFFHNLAEKLRVTWRNQRSAPGGWHLATQCASTISSGPIDSFIEPSNDSAVGSATERLA